MTDETRDALLLAVAEAVKLMGREIKPHPTTPISEQKKSWKAFDDLHSLLARARHEIERPEDRG